ncbi:unnamed protein product [Prorocentrum cordatum]|uniref:Uncharacterized protein n=1 Tax=Prorocentrum cordatum TaxID=2364126 RepID=A0ABN9W2G6_9DINO|nr:unnamed protein product [Polarella glacialis]
MKRICHEAVVPVLVSENEVIFSLEEVPSEPPHVIFLEKGLLTYQLGGGAIQDVHPGQWISEQVLWTDWVYQGTLCSVTPSRLLMLNSMVFQNVLSTKAPQGTLSAEVAKYATEFLKQLNSSKYGDRSDLGSHDACARLAAQCSGTDLQDSTPDAPERRMSGSLGMNAVQEFHARAAQLAGDGEEARAGRRAGLPARRGAPTQLGVARPGLAPVGAPPERARSSGEPGRARRGASAGAVISASRAGGWAVPSDHR